MFLNYRVLKKYFNLRKDIDQFVRDNRVGANAYHLTCVAMFDRNLKRFPRVTYQCQRTSSFSLFFSSKDSMCSTPEVLEVYQEEENVADIEELWCHYQEPEYWYISIIY